MTNKQLEQLIYSLESLNDGDFTLALVWLGQNPDTTRQKVIALCKSLQGEDFIVPIKDEEYNHFLIQITEETEEALGYADKNQIFDDYFVDPVGKYEETELRVTDVTDVEKTVECLTITNGRLFNEHVTGQVAMAGIYKGIAITQQEYEEHFC